MIVTCNTLDEFITELQMSGGNVYQKLVRVSISKNPILDSPRQSPKDALKHSITIQASAIREVEDGGQYLVQFGKDCGKDYSDSGGVYEGTEEAECVKSVITTKCKELGLKIGPGVLQI